MMLTGAMAGVAPVALASTCAASTLNAQLSGVAATSPSNAWVAGDSWNGTAGQTLIEQWNGSAWCTMTTPDPGGPAEPNTLYSVAATSATNAWAVGYYGSSTGDHTLILHWDGTAWTQVPSPNPSDLEQNHLFSVAATSATNAWAVGSYATNNVTVSLILHWDGTAWTQVPSPDPGPYDTLSKVAATSPVSAWAVGQYGSPTQTLALRWNGVAWVHVHTPNVGGTTAGHATRFQGVAATSASNAWAVGDYNGDQGDGALIAHWNGTAWRKVPSPGLGRLHYGTLAAVAVTSATNAWAAGYYQVGLADRTLIAHWDGTAWKKITTPNPGTADDGLSAVAATSPTNAWAVGYCATTAPVEPARTLILHWNGTAWAHIPSP
jgi:hypothetical protein